VVNSEKSHSNADVLINISKDLKSVHTSVDPGKPVDRNSRTTPFTTELHRSIAETAVGESEKHKRKEKEREKRGTKKVTW